MIDVESSGPVPQARPWKALALAISVVAALRLVFILFRYDAYGIAKYFLADDSFYYFQVARKLAAGLGSTFDGVHVSNGYHPLWLLISAAVFRLVPGPNAPLVVLYVLQIGMMIASAAVLYLALREIDDVAAAFTAALFIASYHTRGILFLGMESAPAFLLTAILLLLAMRWRARFFLLQSGRDALMMFALLLGLALARLEAALLAVGWVVTAFTLDARRGGRARTRILLVALGLAAAGCAYVAVNLAMVGMPVPISGLVKAGGLPTWHQCYQVFTLHRDALAALIGPPGWARGASFVRPLEAVVLALSLVAFLLELRRRDPDRFLALVPFLVFVAGFVAVASIVTRGCFGWYMWPALLAGVVATFAVIRVWLVRVRLTRVAPALVAAVAVASTVGGWVAVARTRTLADWGPMRGPAMDAAVRYIREQIPPGDRIGGISSGIFTYFSGRDIENLEGLANGAEFYRVHQNPRAYGNYLRKNGIRWVVFHTQHTADRSQVIDEFQRACGVDSVIDLDRYYSLDMRHSTPEVPDPDVCVLRLHR